MGIKLKDLGGKEVRSASVDYQGDTLNFVYKAGRLTPRVQSVSNDLFQIARKQRDRQKLLDEGRELPEDEDRGETMDEIADAMDGFLRVLVDLLVSWDIIDDDGTPLPITLEILDQVPFDLLSLIFGKIMGDNSPNAKSAAS